MLTFTLASLSTGSANTSSFVCLPIEVELECDKIGVAHGVCYWFNLQMVSEEDFNETDRVIEGIRGNKRKIEKNKRSRMEKKEREERKNDEKCKKEKKKEKMKEGKGIKEAAEEEGREEKEEEDKDKEKDEDDKDEDEDEEEKVGKRKEAEEDVEGNDMNRMEKELISSFPYCLTTGPLSLHHTQHISLKGSSPSHYRQAATLLSDPRPLVPGDIVTLEVGVDISFGVICNVLPE